MRNVGPEISLALAAATVAASIFAVSAAKAETVLDLTGAVPQSGTINGAIFTTNVQQPTGTGVIVLAASYVEVFKNTITHNNSASVSIISYFTTGNPLNDAAYYPYTEAVTFTTTSSAAVESIRPAVMPRSLRPSRENHCR